MQEDWSSEGMTDQVCLHDMKLRWGAHVVMFEMSPYYEKEYISDSRHVQCKYIQFVFELIHINPR